MNGKWITLITVFVFVMAGLVGSAFVLNWLTARFIGAPADPQQSHVDEVKARKERGKEYKEREQAYKAKLAERFEKERPSPETLAKIARAEVPKPLSTSEFDPKTGNVLWPELLLADEYEQPRAKLERLLKQRATTAGDDHQDEAHEAAEQMFSILKENIRSVPANDYIAAHKFLDSLAYALRQ